MHDPSPISKSATGLLDELIQQVLELRILDIATPVLYAAVAESRDLDAQDAAGTKFQPPHKKQHKVEKTLNNKAAQGRKATSRMAATTNVIRKSLSLDRHDFVHAKPSL